VAGNSNLKDSFKQRQDEFYTQLSLIESELKHYKKHFKGKVVLCNCDDPYESNFFKYFAMNFNSLGLQKLIATCYIGSPIANTQLSLFDDEPPEDKTTRAPHKIEIVEVNDYTGDGRVGLADVEYLLRNRKNVLTRLKGDGDFRSKECIELLKQSDVVVTNPPFSLFREYVAQLMEYEKSFIIIGNQNAVAYKEFFPLLAENKVWLGYMSGHFWFKVPDIYEEKATDFKIDENGQKWRRMGNICWFTNLDIEKRHEDMTLFRTYSPDVYPKYDNYDAIEVSRTADIPCDYYGVMGVPVTFMDKFNPDQFQVIGLSQKCGFGEHSTKLYDDYREVRQDGTPTGSMGKKTNGNPMLSGKPESGNYYTNDVEFAYSLYSRIFIVRKQGAE
jgi:hypothetical protein